jgi:hypothetical protein
MEIAAGEPEWDGPEEQPPPSDNPNVGYCSCTTKARRPDLAVVAGAAFECLPVELTPAAFVAFGTCPRVIHSAPDGSVQVSLPRKTTFRYRWGGASCRTRAATACRRSQTASDLRPKVLRDSIAAPPLSGYRRRWQSFSR